MIISFQLGSNDYSVCEYKVAPDGDEAKPAVGLAWRPSFASRSGRRTIYVQSEKKELVLCATDLEASICESTVIVNSGQEAGL